LKIVDKGTNGNKDLQTEADRAAQFCIENSLQKKFDNKLKIVGEEEITSIVPNIELGVSADVLSLYEQCPDELKSVSADDIVVWVDPLDGTSEFAKAAATRSRNYLQTTLSTMNTVV
jgi:3'(2'), 5'-bisphosphate nucleotidase